MRKLNFKEFRIPEGISGKRYRTVDAREAIADLLYTCVNGIRAHRLAFKIYESEGMTEYSDEEAALVRRTVEEHCLPAVIDGLAAQLDKGTVKECVTPKDE